MLQRQYTTVSFNRLDKCLAISNITKQLALKKIPLILKESLSQNINLVNLSEKKIIYKKLLYTLKSKKSTLFYR